MTAKLSYFFQKSALQFVAKETDIHGVHLRVQNVFMSTWIKTLLNPKVNFRIQKTHWRTENKEYESSPTSRIVFHHLLIEFIVLENAMFGIETSENETRCKNKQGIEPPLHWLLMNGHVTCCKQQEGGRTFQLTRY